MALHRERTNKTDVSIYEYLYDMTTIYAVAMYSAYHRCYIGGSSIENLVCWYDVDTVQLGVSVRVRLLEQVEP